MFASSCSRSFSAVRMNCASGVFRIDWSVLASEFGLSVFGVGLNFGNELVYHISKLRGGNFFFLESPEKIAKVFDTEFDYLVTPLVYDLKVRIETPKGLKLKAVYGLPTWKPGDEFLAARQKSGGR